MMLFMLAVTLLVEPAAASGGFLYGTRGGCLYLSGDIDSGPGLEDDGSPAYFDGKRIGGQDWGCDLSKVGDTTYRGACEGEGNTWSLSVTIVTTDVEAAITAPGGRTFTLARCDGPSADDSRLRLWARAGCKLAIVASTPRRLIESLGLASAFK